MLILFKTEHFSINQNFELMNYPIAREKGNEKRKGRVTVASKLYKGMLGAFYQLYRGSPVSLPPRKFCTVWRLLLARDMICQACRCLGLWKHWQTSLL